MGNISVTSISPNSGVGSGIAETVTVEVTAFNGRTPRDPKVLTVGRSSGGSPSHTVTLTQPGALSLSMSSQPYTMQSQGTGFTISGSSNARMLRIVVGNGSIVGGAISGVTVITAGGQLLTVGSGISNANAGYYDLSSDPGADAVYSFSFTFSASDNPSSSILTSHVNVYAYSSNNTGSEPGLSHQLTVNQAAGNSGVDPGGGGSGEEEQETNFIDVYERQMTIPYDPTQSGDPEYSIAIAASDDWAIDCVTGADDALQYPEDAHLGAAGYEFLWGDGTATNNKLYLDTIDGAGTTGPTDYTSYINIMTDPNTTNSTRYVDISLVLTSPDPYGGYNTGVTVRIIQNTQNFA